MKRFVVMLSVLIASQSYVHATEVKVTINPKQEGPTISRHIFGQFAEHLGRGIYEGVWVGPNSKIPNTRGIRSDVVAALKDLKVPNVRWPGGCFADEYHWRDGVGKPSERRLRINASWANRPEPNTFGSHEYFDFLQQIGAEAFISANVGSGTVQESSDWLEYLTADKSSLAQERAANGHPKPYEVTFWGIGNEAWGCGGPFTAEEYLKELKRFSNYTVNYNNAKQTLFVAVGPDGDDFAEYTEVIMKAWSQKSWAWDMQRLSLHRYTRNGWPPNIKATNFGEAEYAAVVDEALGMDAFIKANAKVMDKYDPDKTIGIMVDEWGVWAAPTEGTDAQFLEQQNSQRDAIVAALNFNIFFRHAERVQGANIAQMVNVLQAMILTDQDKMVLTPTYHAFKLYVPFQDATRLPTTFKHGKYKVGKVILPSVDAIAARTKSGKVIVALTNINGQKPVSFIVDVKDQKVVSMQGNSLYAPAIDAVNTFTNPSTVQPMPVSVEGNAIQVQPQSVTVLDIQFEALLK